MGHIEEDRLKYLQMAQSSHCVEQEDMVCTYMALTPNPDKSIPARGLPVFLPSSFMEGLGYLQQNTRAQCVCAGNMENPLDSLQIQNAKKSWIFCILERLFMTHQN